MKERKETGKMSKTLDEILQLLEDEKWHGVKEIKEETPLPEEEADGILPLLDKMEMVEVEKEKGEIEEVKIGSFGTEILDLPSEIDTGR